MDGLSNIFRSAKIKIFGHERARTRSPASQFDVERASLQEYDRFVSCIANLVSDFNGTFSRFS